MNFDKRLKARAMRAILLFVLNLNVILHFHVRRLEMKNGKIVRDKLSTPDGTVVDYTYIFFIPQKIRTFSNQS